MENVEIKEMTIYARHARHARQNHQRAGKDCHTVVDVHEMLKNLFKDTLQEVLEAELDNHLGHEKHSPEGNNTGNSRNGYSKKTVKTKFGETELTVPRDRNGEFEPKVIKKYENNLPL